MESMTFRYIGNDCLQVAEFVKALVDTYSHLIKEDDRFGLELGLSEILINSIEHGNLGITFEAKVEALRSGMEELAHLREARRKDPDMGNRTVAVESAFDGAAITWTITDEGNGFDHELIHDPNGPCSLETPCGRGICLASMQFDAMEYSEGGRRVRLVKRIAS